MGNRRPWLRRTAGRPQDQSPHADWAFEFPPEDAKVWMCGALTASSASGWCIVADLARRAVWSTSCPIEVVHRLGAVAIGAARR